MSEEAELPNEEERGQQAQQSTFSQSKESYVLQATSGAIGSVLALCATYPLCVSLLFQHVVYTCDMSANRIVLLSLALLCLQEDYLHAPGEQLDLNKYTHNCVSGVHNINETIHLGADDASCDFRKLVFAGNQPHVTMVDVHCELHKVEARSCWHNTHLQALGAKPQQQQSMLEVIRKYRYMVQVELVQKCNELRYNL